MKVLLQRGRAAARSLLTFDRGPAEATTLVVGAGRSGTSWLGRVVARDLSAREMFEPFDPRRTASLVAAGRRRYVPHHHDGPELAELYGSVLSGHVRSTWIDGQSPPGVFRARVVKEIRCCPSLGWIGDNFPWVKIVYIIRNPWANILSRTRLGWGTEAWVENPDDMLTDYPRLAPLGGDLDSDLAEQMRMWSIDVLLALTQLEPNRAHVVFYEELVDPATAALDNLRRQLGIVPNPLHGRRQPRATQPSRPSDHAREMCGERAFEEATRVLEIAGLADLYSPTPNHRRIEKLVGQARRPRDSTS